MVEVATNDVINVKNDIEISISTAKKRTSTDWKNKTLMWSEMVEKLSRTTRTYETAAEYNKMTKADKGKVKDVGGFVGGSLKGGKRRVGSVANRTLLTLDIDYCKKDIWEDIQEKYKFSLVMYSTHTHTPENPRYRLVIPLSRPTLPDEYEATARMVADMLDINIFDDTTYEPCRLMYWPSTSQDGEYIFKFQDTYILDPDTILDKYLDWKDISYWPESDRNKAKLNRSLAKQEDPLTKPGVIGAFCRSYSISEAIETFIPDIYVPGANEDRYTYAEGSTTGGIVVYEDKFSYSHHGTDPATGVLCNAFDLIRIQKFSDLDIDCKDTVTSKLPSFKAMQEFAAADKKVITLLGKETQAKAAEEFKKLENEENWFENLEYNTSGKLTTSPGNFVLILSNDPNLKDKFGYNEFSNRIEVTGQLPWRRKGDFSEWKDSDDSSLRIYIAQVWKINNRANCLDAFNEITVKNSFHPVREYLEGLKWDGIARLDTLLIDYMSCKDSPYTRAISRKWMVGAVARIFEPGCKFDNMLVLQGEQGLYKSTFFRILSNGYFTDSLQDVEGNQAIEKITGSWIVEIGELQAFNRSESNAIKRFITSQEDKTRLAYAHRTSYIKRQCVFAGTTNEQNFLKDKTGNRRYWPVEVKREGRKKDVVKDLPDEVDQLWAEAVYRYQQGEKLYLDSKLEKIAETEQEQFSEVNEKQGLIEKYLNTKLPKNWDNMDTWARINYLEGNELEGEPGTIERTEVCALEIWCECFGKNKADIKRADSMEINSILTGLKGWSKMSATQRHKLYGVQRFFKRV